jgi:hypothetical protein
MGRTVDEIIAALPKQRRARIDARYHELKDEVESLAALRKAAGKAPADLAAILKIKQLSISKIEKQTDMYLSTLRSYVEAIGGELDLIVRLPARRAVRLNRLGDALDGSAKGKSQPRATRARARPVKKARRRVVGAA